MAVKQDIYHQYQTALFQQFYHFVGDIIYKLEENFLPNAEYEDKTMMCADARLIEYQSGDVLCDS